MLGACLEHGYYRGERCPVCDTSGKFLMNDEEMESIGRLMAGLLRHFPEKFGLSMDQKGWVSLIDMIEAVKRRRRQFHWLRQHHVRAMIDTDKKGRYQVVGNSVRATYGHTIDVDPDLPTINIPDVLFYPSSQDEIDLHMESGLMPVDRKKVHLSLTLDAAMIAGEHRVENPVILKVDALGAIKEGYAIGEAGSTVYITKEIPSAFLEKVEDVDFQEMRLINLE